MIYVCVCVWVPLPHHSISSAFIQTFISRRSPQGYFLFKGGLFPATVASLGVRLWVSGDVLSDDCNRRCINKAE